MYVKYLANVLIKIFQGKRFYNMHDETRGEHYIANVQILSGNNVLRMQSLKYYWADICVT